MWAASFAVVESSPTLLGSILGLLCLLFVPPLVIGAAADEVERRKAAKP
jgi:hypothetical protein